MKRLILGWLFAILSVSFAFAACPAGTYFTTNGNNCILVSPTDTLPVGSAFTQTARAPDLSVSSASSSVALGASAYVARICNTGTVNAYAAMGNSTVTVTTSNGILIIAGQCVNLNVGSSTYLAAITASSTTTLQTSLGSGLASLGGGGGSGGGTANTVPQYYAAATDASIRSFGTLVCNNSPNGGTVNIPGAIITLVSPLPVCSGLVYQGAPMQAAISSGQTVGVGGTILQGDGTFDAIDYNSTDLGAPLANTNAFLAAMLNGFGANDLTFVNFRYGIKIGALYNPGCSYCNLNRLNFINNTQWGAWLENYNNSRFTTLYATNNAVGQIARVGSGGALYNGGNSIWTQTESNNLTTGLARNLVSWTRASSTTTQDTYIGEGPSQALVTETVQVAIMNASANITVTDGTKFPLDMPIVFSNTVNGFTANQIYFIVSQSANVVQVGNTMRGTAVGATGNSAVNIKQKGFPIQEIVGLDSGSGFSAIKSYGLDIEGSASTQLVIQNAVYGTTIDLGIIGGDTYKSITRRGTAKGQFYSLSAFTTFDDDASSYPNFDIYNNAGDATVRVTGASAAQGINLPGGANFGYNTANSARWTIGGVTASGSSTNDSLVVGSFANSYGYMSMEAPAANGNVALAMQQGNGNGGSGNQFAVIGVVGTNADSTYGLSTSQSGRGSGDFIFQVYNSGFFQPLYVPAGANNAVIRGTATNNNAPAAYVGEVMSSNCPGAATTATVTITIASPGVVTWTGHGFTTSCPVVFTTTGALPTGITSGTVYYVVPSSVATNTFQIATSLANALAGTAVNTSGSQSGTQTGTAGASAATTVAIGVTGLALTAGDWDCSASLTRGLAASTSVTLLKSSINTSIADGSLSTGTMSQFSTAANVMVNDHTEIIVPVRESLSATTNVFLVQNDTFSVSTNKGYGQLRCRRMR